MSWERILGGEVKLSIGRRSILGRVEGVGKKEFPL